jgi:hypothetical protein
MASKPDYLAIGKNASGWKPYTAFALTVLCLAGQLGSFAHVLARHVTCVEHGEVIHPDDARRVQTTAAGSDNLARADVRTYRASPIDRAIHGHDHCLISSHRRERLTLDALPHSTPIDPPLPVRFGVERDAEPASGVALFLLAPKNSPPV